MNGVEKLMNGVKPRHIGFVFRKELRAGRPVRYLTLGLLQEHVEENRYFL